MKALFFDLDDTLLWDKKSIKESLRATCLEAEEQTGIHHKELEKTVREEAASLYASYDTYEFTKSIGINPFEGLWGDFTDDINIGFRKMNEIIYDYQEKAWTHSLSKHGVSDSPLGSTLAERFRFHRRKLPFIYADTFEVLAELKENYRLLLLTNGAPSLQQEKLNMTPQLVPFFEYIVVSGAYGIGKPAPSIFEHCLDLMQLSSDDALMIGDNLHTDILGSNRAGMKNIWINREKKEPNKDIPFTWEVQSLSEIPGLL
ncbi:HAD family hydrolase [Alteribacillus iranensis]|uniref:Phosphoserine phosphatase n=1 Tax=Alteribacillus iranensis TaxID=930128 RepID=A0A1I1ZW42_9BACI|nr:HAD family hydrolase [Alteribacillus iranensis]SFE35852.1 putative hydrolase of the HAD superfamily [Alteribacillus iranensis]